MDPFELAASLMEFVEQSSELLMNQSKPKQKFIRRPAPNPLPPKAPAKKEIVAKKETPAPKPAPIQRNKSFDHQDRLRYHPMFGMNYNPGIREQHGHFDFSNESSRMKFMNANPGFYQSGNQQSYPSHPSYKTTSALDYSTNYSHIPEDRYAISICRICRREPVAIKFLPCKHQICCIDCALKSNECRKCQSHIEERVTLKGVSLSSDDNNVVSLRKRVRSLESNRVCTVCMERPKDTVFGCGHVACEQCSRSLKLCHMCRRKIITKTKIYDN